MKRWGIILFLLSILPLFNLMTPGIMDAHDAPDHVGRIANFYQSLTEGTILPRWAGNLNWGYGHPILMFLYPFPSYLASLFHFLGITLVDSVKLVFAVSYVASIMAFFLWAGLAWNPLAGFVGAILYGFAPYRFVDLYVRGALGEHVAFAFAPVILLGLIGLAKQKHWAGWCLTLGLTGLLLSHNAVSLMLMPLVLLYGIYLFMYEAKNRRMFIAYCLLSLVLSFSLAAFFWIPAFFEGKYTLRDIVTRGEFANRFVPLTKFIYSPWNYGISNEFTKELGFAQWIMVVAGIFYAPVVVALLLFSLLIQTSTTGWIWDTVTILQKFQFPWRFLTVSVLLSATIGSIVTYAMPKKKYMFLIIAGIAIISTFSMWRAKSYSIRPETYYTGIYDSTTDTGESSPIWSVRFMEQRPATDIEVIEGSATISAITRTSTKHEYDISSQSKTRFVENTLYFPGWRVLVDGSDVPVEFQDPNYRGLMTFWTDAGDHRVQVELGETKLRLIADAITLAGLLVLSGAVTIRICSRWPLRFSTKKKISKHASHP